MSKFNEEIVQKIHDQSIDLFRNAGMTVGEILVTYGNIGRTLGLAIAGHVETIPSQEEIEIEYYKNPTPGTALVLQGLEVIGWFEKWSTPSETTKEKENKNA